MKEYVLNKLINNEVFSNAEKDVIKNNIDIIVKMYRIFAIEDFNKRL